MSTRKKHQCHSCQALVKGHRRGPDGTFICPTNFPLPPNSRVAPTPFPRQGTILHKMASPIRRGMTIELDEKGDQVLVNGHKYSRIMPGTLDSQVWTWTNAGNPGGQAMPEILEIDDDSDGVEIIDEEDDDDGEVEYEGEIPRLSTRPPSMYPRTFSSSRTPAPSTHRHPTARSLGKRRQMDHEREMSIVSAAGEDWPLASLYRIPSNRVRQVVREARIHGLCVRVIPRSHVVPVPVGNSPAWIKEEEYEEEDSGFFEEFGETSSGRVVNGDVGSRRKERDWEVILGTDEGAVEDLQRIVLDGQEGGRQRESRRAITYHHPPPPPPVVSNPPPLVGLSAPTSLPAPSKSGTNWSSILIAMMMGAAAMFYLLLKIPDD